MNLYDKIYRLIFQVITAMIDFFYLKYKNVDSSEAEALKNLIIFYGRDYTPRIHKLICEFIRKGIIPVLIIDFFEEGSSIPSEVILHRSRNRFHSGYLLKRYLKHVLIYYGSDSRFCSLHIEKHLGYKIFDNYDNYSLYYKGKSPYLFMNQLIISEKKCYTYCDLVLARNIEASESLRNFSLAMKRKFFLPDICEESKFCFKQKDKINLSKNVNLVYCGGLYGHKERNRTHGFDDFSDLYKALKDTNLIIHLYPNPFQNESHYRSILELSKVNLNVRVYQSIPYKKLVEEITQYDFGIIPHYILESYNVNPIKLKYATSNKFINFLEAGLPIIITDELVFMAWLVTRYNLGTVISKKDFEKLPEIVSKVDYSYLCQNVEKFRIKLASLDRVTLLYNYLNKKNVKN